MNHGRLKSLALIAALGLALALPAALAQSSGAKQDITNAGADTRHAATNVGHGVSQGTKTTYNKTKSGTQKGYRKTSQGTRTAYNKTKSGTKSGYHKTTQATRSGVRRVQGKPATPVNNHPQ